MPFFCCFWRRSSSQMNASCVCDTPFLGKIFFGEIFRDLCRDAVMPPGARRSRLPAWLLGMAPDAQR
jgi:hypothetical protein